MLDGKNYTLSTFPSLPLGANIIAEKHQPKLAKPLDREFMRGRWSGSVYNCDASALAFAICSGSKLTSAKVATASYAARAPERSLSALALS